MKKLLLSLALMFGLSTAASAAPITVDFSTAEGLPTADSEVISYVTLEGVNFGFVNCKKASSYNYVMITGKGHVGEAYMTFSLPEACEKFTVTTPAGSSKSAVVQLYVNDTAIGDEVKFNNPGADFTFEIPVANQAAGTVYKLVATANYNVQVGKIVFNGDGGSVPPTPELTEVANIAAMMALDKDTKVKFTSPVTVLWQHANYLYIHDNTGNTVVYGNLNNDYTNGMTIPAGFEGTVGEYNGLKQLVPSASTFEAGVAGAAVEPEVLQVEEVAADLAYAYVKFVGVEISGSARNYTMTDASGSVTLYQQWTDIEIPTGANYTVVGFIGLYKGNAQVLCAEVTTAGGQEIVATPTFSVASGAVPEGTEVAISCATEGATIYYTVDGTAPTAASAVYSTPIVVNEALTLQAIAVKEGMDDSNVATAEYTIKAAPVISGNTAVFNFAEPETLDPAYNVTESVEVSGVVFTNNGVEFVSDASGASTPTRLWVNKGNWTYRFYKGSVITIKCATGYKITEVAFETTTATELSACEFSEGKYEDKVLTIPAERVANSVEITNTDKAVYLTKVTVTFEGISGIADVELNENAPVEYFNLQGVRVQGDLTPGLYIRRQGNNATKVLVK